MPLTTKDRLLALLETQRGGYFSGEELARRLEVSRAAVWKAVNALRAAGYAIDAAPNRGYCLAAGTDVLSPQGVQRLLDPGCPVTLQAVDSTPSTNALLRELAADGAPEGCAVLANAQTEGRGRGGRRFYSPPGTGVYLSVLLRPRDLPPDQAVRVTTMAALAACEAVEAVCGRRAAVKWVNDIYLDGRKVCGILTEGSLGLESGRLESVVLGAGFNLYAPAEGFPAELAQTAGAVLDAPQPDAKNRLAAAFLNRFWACYTGQDPGWPARYRDRSLALGRTVTVLRPDGACDALALDVDEDCRLVVRYANGRVEHLNGGEIRIRL